MTYRIRFNKTYGKYQVSYGAGKHKVVLEEFKRKASAKKYLKGLNK